MIILQFFLFQVIYCAAEVEGKASPAELLWGSGPHLVVPRFLDGSCMAGCRRSLCCRSSLFSCRRNSALLVRFQRRPSTLQLSGMRTYRIMTWWLTPAEIPLRPGCAVKYELPLGRLYISPDDQQGALVQLSPVVFR